MTPPNDHTTDYQTMGFATRAIHAGQEPDPITGAVIPPISLSTTFAQESAGVPKSSFEYSRHNNPTRLGFETAVAALENGRHCLAFASGSVTTASVTQLLSHGSHIAAVNDVYGGTFRYFTKVAKNNGIDVDFVDLFNPENIKTVIKSNTKMIWIETPTNPTLKLVDIKAICTIAHQINRDIMVVVDNTFMSPYFQNPLSLGADIVVHSVTKYINGHSDCVMGVAIMNDQTIYQNLKFLQNAIGGIPSPFDCFLAHRGLKTLPLRMEKHAKNAFAVATFLESSPHVLKCIYPGLASHPQHSLALSQQKGFGGMISFRIKHPSINKSNAFLKNLKLFALAESLGGVESLAELPAVMTHASLTQEARDEIGVDDGLIRLSVGIEDEMDLIQDLKRALEISSNVE